MEENQAPAIQTFEERLSADVTLVKNELITSEYGEQIEKIDPIQKITEMEKELMVLKTNGPEDKEAYALVRSKRLEVKAVRIRIEKKADSLKEQSIIYQKSINGIKNELVTRLKVIESYLDEQETIVDKALEERKLEEQRKKAELISVRMKSLTGRGLSLVNGIYHYTSPHGNGSLEYGAELLALVSDEEFKAFMDRVITITDSDADIEKEKAEKLRIVSELRVNFEKKLTELALSKVSENVWVRLLPITNQKLEVKVETPYIENIPGYNLFVADTLDKFNLAIEDERVALDSMKQKEKDQADRKKEMDEREAKLKLDEEKAKKERDDLAKQQSEDHYKQLVETQNKILKLRTGLLIAAGCQEKDGDRLVLALGTQDEVGLIEYSVLKALPDEMFDEMMKEVPIMLGVIEKAKIDRAEKQKEAEEWKRQRESDRVEKLKEAITTLEQIQNDFRLPTDNVSISDNYLVEGVQTAMSELRYNAIKVSDLIAETLTEYRLELETKSPTQQAL